MSLDILKGIRKAHIELTEVMLHCSDISIVERGNER